MLKSRNRFGVNANWWRQRTSRKSSHSLSLTSLLVGLFSTNRHTFRQMRTIGIAMQLLPNIFILDRTIVIYMQLHIEFIIKFFFPSGLELISGWEMGVIIIFHTATHYRHQNIFPLQLYTLRTSETRLLPNYLLLDKLPQFLFYILFCTLHTRHSLSKLITLDKRSFHIIQVISFYFHFEVPTSIKLRLLL